MMRVWRGVKNSIHCIAYMGVVKVADGKANVSFTAKAFQNFTMRTNQVSFFKKEIMVLMIETATSPLQLSKLNCETFCLFLRCTKFR